jgi:hypothetical protein
MTEYFPAKFVYKGNVCSAQLTNLSEKGAHLQVGANDHVKPKLLIGKELALDIVTPYGKSHCTAQVKWLDPKSEQSSFGVEFTRLSQKESDPLRCAIASPF